MSIIYTEMHPDSKPSCTIHKECTCNPSRNGLFSPSQYRNCNFCTWPGPSNKCLTLHGTESGLAHLYPGFDQAQHFKSYPIPDSLR